MEPSRLTVPAKPESDFLALAGTLSALIALIRGEKIFYVNPAGCRLLGRTPEYFTDKRFWDVVHPDDREAAKNRGLARQAGIPQPTRYAERLIHADGHVVWVDYSVDVLMLDGIPTTLVTGHDITEQKKAEEAIRKSERTFRNLYKQSPVMMWSVGWDSRFREVSDALLKKLGYERSEIIGRDSRDCLTPESRVRVDEMIARHQAQRLWTTRFFPLQVRCKNGDILDIQFSSVPELDDEGQPTGWICVAADLSEITRTQEALKLSEARFRLAFENAAIGKAIAGIDYTLYQVNRAYANMLGYEPPEILTRSTLELTHPDDVAENRALLARLLKGPESSGRMTKRYRHKDGHIVWGELTLTVIRDAEGKPLFFVGEVVDITERKKTGEALRESEERFRSAFQNAAIGKAIAGPDLKLIEANQAYAGMLGYTPEELRSVSTLDITHPEDVEKTRAMGERLLSGAGTWSRVVKRYVRKDGGIVWGDLSATLIRDAEGRPKFFVGEVIDITERKKTEEALRLSEERFRAAFHNAAIGKAITSAGMKLLQVNRAFCDMLGYTEAELLNVSPAKLTHPDDIADSAALVEKLMTGAAPSGRTTKRYFHRDGRIVWVDLTTTLIRDGEGKPSYFATEVVDITDRRRSEEMIRDREAKLAEAQAIAHVGSWEYLLPSNKVVWSDEMYRIWGIDPARFDRTLDDVFARIHPKDRERSREVVARAVEKGEPYEFEYSVVRDNGEIRELWSRARVEHDATGKPQRLYGITQDITDRKRAEELARDREAKLALAQRVAHVGSWEWDVVTGAILWSDEMYRIVGVDPASHAPSYDDYMSRVHPEDRPAVVAQVQAGFKDGKPYEHENRLMRPDGIRRVWTRCHMDKDASGRVTRLYGITQDLTERKAAEEALRTSEQRFRTLYSQAPVLMTVVGPDRKFRDVSNYWLQMMGYERHEVIGQEGYKFITPESQVRHREAVEKAIRSGEPVIRNVPLQGVRKDGTTVDVLTTSLAELDDKGNFLGALTVGVNLSDVRRAEEAIRESDERYRAMVQHAPEAIVVADGDDGKFVDVNEQAVRLFRRTREQLLALGPAEASPAFQPDGRPSAEKAQDMIRRTADATQVFEWTHMDGEGRDIPCLIHLSKMPHRTRNLIRATIFDISRQKAMEEKLRQDDRMAAIGVLAAGVAHEIGNPLLALSMAAQSLERKAQDEYSAKKLALIREHIDRISKIVRQMSDLARAPVQTRATVDLNRVLERSMEIVRYDRRAKAVAIDVAPCGDIPFVQAAEDQLVQVTLNLALNALDAVAANPPERPKSLSISVRCVERDGRRWVRAAFRDTGPGIPESSRPKIFQPFYTTKEPGKGTGLGLSVSYRIIEEHQGKLGFDTDPSSGTEFYFELPVREKP